MYHRPVDPTLTGVHVAFFPFRLLSKLKRLPCGGDLGIAVIDPEAGDQVIDLGNSIWPEMEVVLLRGTRGSWRARTGKHLEILPKRLVYGIINPHLKVESAGCEQSRSLESFHIESHST
jgi:hypothetical protein